MELTKEQLETLNHVVMDAQVWADHAESNFGLEKATKFMLAKVARYKPDHDKCLSEGDYKNRAVRESEIINPADQTKWTPMKRWKFAMAKQERMGGIDRDFEDLITDNPALVLNEYTQTKYDDKVALRATKP
jgi:hypothetical protein